MPKKNEFTDPILRCDGCSVLVHRVYLAKEGGCHNCGNRRFRNVLVIKEDEWRALHNGVTDFGIEKEDWYPLDGDFLKLFEGVGR